MKYIYLLLIVISLATPAKRNPIITRHDRADSVSINFAKELPVISSIVKYSSTDVAGTLITPQWVLSAAHVAETIKDGQKLIQGTDSLIVEKVVIHPGWLEHGRPEDIALIKLKIPVSNVVTPGLYKNRDEAGQEVIVAGNGDYGTGLTGPEGNDGVFRAATNRIEEASENYLKWKFENPDSEPNLVTALEGISGPGDSSGPAFIKEGNVYFIAGISSGQSTKATNGKEGFYGVTEYYTRVSSYINWIEEIIAE